MKRLQTPHDGSRNCLGVLSLRCQVATARPDLSRLPARLCSTCGHKHPDDDRRSIAALNASRRMGNPSRSGHFGSISRSDPELGQQSGPGVLSAGRPDLFGPSALAPRPDHHDHEDQDERRHYRADDDRRQSVAIHRQDDPADDLRDHQRGPGRLPLHSASVAQKGRLESRRVQRRAIAADPRQASLGFASRLPELVDADERADRTQHPDGPRLVEVGEAQADHPDGHRELRRRPVDHGHDAAHGLSVAHGRHG